MKLSTAQIQTDLRSKAKYETKVFANLKKHCKENVAKANAFEVADQDNSKNLEQMFGAIRKAAQSRAPAQPGVDAELALLSDTISRHIAELNQLLSSLKQEGIVSTPTAPSKLPDSWELVDADAIRAKFSTGLKSEADPSGLKREPALQGSPV